MAVRIKKRVESSQDNTAVDAPDQFLAATQETFGWLQSNRNLVLGLIAGLVVVIVVGALVMESTRNRRATNAEPVLRAIALAAGAGQDGMTIAERASAVQSALGDASTSVGALLLGNAQLSQGNADAAKASFASAASGLGSDEQGVVAFGLAASQAQAGNLSEALSTLDHVAATNAANAGPALLQSALLTDAFGEPAAALAAYQRYVAQSAGVTGMSAVQNRISQLQIELGNLPTAD